MEVYFHMVCITELTSKECCSCATHIGYHWNYEEGGELEVGDELGDVSVHLVQLGVLGGDLPVLAPGHRVHNVLGEEGQIIGICWGEIRLT